MNYYYNSNKNPIAHKYLTHGLAAKIFYSKNINNNISIWPRPAFDRAHSKCLKLNSFYSSSIMKRPLSSKSINFNNRVENCVSVSKACPAKVKAIKGEISLKGKNISLPFIESDLISLSRKTMANMLDHLKLLNSPLYTFLTNHTRVKYLTTSEPLPDIKAKILPITRKLRGPATQHTLASVNTVRASVYLAEQTSVVKPHLTKTTLLNN